ncbi:hypothetical protein B0J17DRAFT_629915 [Rhizoctonia solani]|nr:hypothetical protein B0J17DRAFT_629915 [Rhizoctonia solani]
MRRSTRLSTPADPPIPLSDANSDSPAGSSSSCDEPADPIVETTVEQALHIKSTEILEYIRTKGITLGDLLVATCFGNPLSRENELMQVARSSIYQSDNLSKFLENSYKPPRPPSQSGPRPIGGTVGIKSFVLRTAKAIFRDELVEFSRDYTITNQQLVDYDYITSITSESLHQQAKVSCPHLHATLKSLTNPNFDKIGEEFGPISVNEESEDEDNLGSQLPPKKHPDFKILGVYLKAKHTSKAAFYILNQAGVTVSYDTIRKMLSDLSGNIPKKRVIVIFHDNIRLKYGVSSQHGDNQTVTDNGTAISMLVLPDDELACILEDPNDWGPFFRNLVAQHQAGTAPKLTWLDMNSLSRCKRNYQSSIFDILEFLKLVPGLSDSDIWKSAKLK